MAKRRLTDQQRRRIRHNQDAIDTDNTDIDKASTGKVIARFSTKADVEADSDHTIHRCHIRATVDDIVVGDRVAWIAQTPASVITARLERTSLLARQDSFGHHKAMAANIDCIVIVIAPIPEPFLGLIDRHIAAAEFMGINAAIVINKMDLLPATDTQFIPAYSDNYKNIGYQVLPVSSLDGTGMDALTTYLHNKTAIFIGQSGVGKSSLVNNLIPDINTEIGALSESVGKGTHTTTTARLYHFPAGGSLIDSPGIREFVLNYIPEEKLVYCFREFAELPGQCKFRNCRHESEPGCAIKTAVAEGRASQQRFDSYFAILNEIRVHSQH